MAESSLSIGFANLKQTVGRFLGYGGTIDDWSDDQEALVEEYVQSGVRRVYYPPAIEGIPAGYEWSFLRPSTTLEIEEDEYRYDLPDDFGRLIGEFHYGTEVHRKPIPRVSVGAILELRNRNVRTGAPAYAATQYKESTRETGQRQEVLFDSDPDDDYTLYYTYEAYSGALSDDYPYPLGGMQLAELYRASCLAVAERESHDEDGIHNRDFQKLLVDAIARDRKRGPSLYGQMGDRESLDVVPRHGMTGGTYPITYHGEDI